MKYSIAEEHQLFFYITFHTRQLSQILESFYYGNLLSDGTHNIYVILINIIILYTQSQNKHLIEF